MPYTGNWYKMIKRSQIAVELNYRSYRSLRTQDQNGLAVISIDEKKLEYLNKSDIKSYERLLDLIIYKTWWEEILCLIDNITNDFFDIYDYSGISKKGFIPV